MRVEPLDRSFGAKVYDLTLADLDQIEASEIYELWLKYALLIFPAQNLSNDQQINGVEIFTVTGKLALSKSNVNSNVVELTELNLPAGIYVVNTNTNNGMISKKLIIQ